MSLPIDNPGSRLDALVLNVSGGARICVPPDLGQITCYILLEQEDWFEDEIRFVRRWLRPGMRAVDVGASYGLYAMAMARAVGPQGRIWAFEPTSRTADFLARTLELNGCSQVMLSRTAVSDRGGTVAFAVQNRSELNGVAAAGAPASEIVSVPAATLDDLAARHDWNGIDFVKLDVEGHELEVVQGGRRFFGAQSPLVMFEIKTQDRFDLGVVQALAEFEYDFYRLLPGLLILVPFEGDQPIDAYQLNLFACKKDRAARLAAGGFLDDGANSVRSERRAEPASEVWRQYVGSAPYARELASRWPVKAGFFSATATKSYLNGLAAFAGSRDVGASASVRCALLGKAMAYVGEAAGSSGSLAYSISHARLAWETGQRTVAVNLLVKAVDRLEEENGRALEEPFLAPGARFEQVATEGRAGDWLRCAVTEQFEKLRAYSSMFVNDSTSKILGPVRNLPFCSPEMDRRWQLVRMATGVQKAPEAAPSLRARSEENRNPEFWCGAQRA